ncbi:hypothetical protein ABZ419_25285 [Streptomyces cinnamoneus]|uniref:hypothetical protein n=1 Tax=Streptomyces cinnamoneus TaxID=53446 RepID=UPI00340EABD0
MPFSLAAIPALLFITLSYAVLCTVRPFGTCRKCRGFGFAMTTDRKGRPKRGKHCRRCDGHGIRIRLGRHLWNRWSRTYRDGTR